MDRVDSKVRSANMRAIRSKGMKPELVVRRLVHAMGYRYRLHRHDLPGRPDMVFTSRRKVVFVHGCFWHQHSDSACKITHRPKSNLGYWLPKLERNVTRDKAHRSRLAELGWEVLVIWECEVTPSDGLAARIRYFLDH